MNSSKKKIFQSFLVIEEDHQDNIKITKFQPNEKSKKSKNNPMRLINKTTKKVNEKQKFIDLIKQRYPKQNSILFTILYKMNPYRKNTEFLRSIIAFLRIFLISLSFFFEVFYQRIGLFMIPLIVECLIRFFFSALKYCRENFEKRKKIFRWLMLIHILKFGFCVRNFFL